jgi:hypothetical protein
MISPPRTAPPGESNPPSTTAGIAARATRPTPLVTPAAGNEVRKSPPTAASAPASTHAPAVTRLRRMPISEAVSPSSAAERMATPQSVSFTANAKPATSTTATPPAITREAGTRTPATSTTSEPHGAPMLMTSVPMRRVSSVSSRMSTPSVRMARVPRSACRMRRISSASTASDTIALAAIPASTAGQKPIESCRRPIT